MNVGVYDAYDDSSGGDELGETLRKRWKAIAWRGKIAPVSFAVGAGLGRVRVLALLYLSVRCILAHTATPFRACFLSVMCCGLEVVLVFGKVSTAGFYFDKLLLRRCCRRCPL